MKSFVLSILVIFLIGSEHLSAASPEKVTFKSTDGLEVSAEKYIEFEITEAPLIVLFHQAGWSKGEYRETAPKLNALGFNCLAVDQRSGEAVNGVKNETAIRAESQGLKTNYVDALPDMEAALKYAREMGAPRVIGWGSSYSASLVLYLGGTQPGLMDAVLSFSPGEYFGRQGKPGDWISKAVNTIDVPVFITSARDEKGNWDAIFNAVGSSSKTGFIPQTKGNHGSRALWAKFDDHAAYWTAVTTFLQTLKD